jgi:transcriptional antiterminator RfaH
MQLEDKKNKWYLLYTVPRAEKKIYADLQKNGYEVFLPLQKKLVQWSDRKKWVESPLFNSYIFIYTSLSNYYELLNTKGIVKFVSFLGVPVEVSQSQIDIVKLMIANYTDIETVIDKFEEGEHVKIIAGPLQNQLGILIEYKSSKRVLVRIENIGFSLLVQLPNNILRKI